MAFDIDLSPDYPWPVEVGLPENGKAKKLGFTGRFKRMDRPDVEKMIGDAQKGKITDLDICKKVLVGWEGVEASRGDSKEEIPFSQENFDRVMMIHPVASNVAKAWIASATIGVLGN